MRAILEDLVLVTDFMPELRDDEVLQILVRLPLGAAISVAMGK